MPTKDVNGNVTGGTVTLDLKNVLRQFTLRLNKVFGTMYDDNGTKKYAVLDPEDYNCISITLSSNRLKLHPPKDHSLLILLRMRTDWKNLSGTYPDRL